MKYVVVPSPVTVRYGRGVSAPVAKEEIVSMHDFMMDTICVSPAIGKGIEGARRVRKLDKAFSSAEPIVGIEDADYKIVVAVIQEIPWARPDWGMQCLPFMEALEEAEKQNEEWMRKQNIKAVD